MSQIFLPLSLILTTRNAHSQNTNDELGNRNSACGSGSMGNVCPTGGHEIRRRDVDASHDFGNLAVDLRDDSFFSLCFCSLFFFFHYQRGCNGQIAILSLISSCSLMCNSQQKYQSSPFFGQRSMLLKVLLLIMSISGQRHKHHATHLESFHSVSSSQKAICIISDPICRENCGILNKFSADCSSISSQPVVLQCIL